MGEIVEAHVIVAGRVQGVWFRGTTRQVARDAGASGYVRNLHDRRVEAVIQGRREAVQTVIEFMRTGPPGALVTDISVTWRPAAAAIDGFDIRY